MTQHWLLPPCAISLEALSPARPCLTRAQACLPAHLLQMGGTVGGHWQRQMCLFSGDENVVLSQMAVPWSKWQPLTLLPHSLGILTDRAGLLLVMGKLKKENQDVHRKLMEFSISRSLFSPGEQFSFPPDHS